MPPMTRSCSKNSHWSTSARSSGWAGRYGVPSARYQRIAPDCAIAAPDSSSRTGVSRTGLSAAYSSVSVSPAKMSTGHALVLAPEQGEEEADLVAVAGGGVVV